MTARVTGSIRVPAVSRCPQCGADRISPVVCPRCGVAEGVSDDAFALLGLQPSWGVDPQELEERYTAILSLLDPKSEAAATVTAARRLLLDPLTRGRHLVEASGGQPQELGVETQEFLTEVMELSRETEEAIAQRDPARLSGLVTEAEEKLASMIMAAGQSFSRLERTVTDEVAAAARSLAGASYWSAVVDELRDKVTRLEGQRAAGRRPEGDEARDI
ncbi:MAG: 50S ribosomal protein L32 [Thermoanaerobaculia bacterium]|nr:50S ribosomal protein L32 [Thermoanaerobaculia bacterium]